MLITVCKEDKFLLERVFMSSINRTKEKLESGQNVEAE